ncbi:MAG TPA: iron chelate uptake ABC transporter family permease subunit [Syntrophomonadaceae bacterium]|nr:iron chelate uptake ABC transporter family permease subunit [Syntrophomonadaceae bacterium]
MAGKYYIRGLFLTVLLLGALLLTVAFSVATGSADISPLAALRVMASHMPGLSHLAGAHQSQQIDIIIMEIRFPRVMLAFFVGAALAVAGAALQGLLRNPLAEPYTIGVSAGASVGAAVMIIIFRHGTFLGNAGLPLAAFVGALITALAVYRIAQVDGYLAVETLILSGVIMNSFMSAVLSYLLTVAGQNLQQIVFWLMGNLSLRGSEYFIYTIPLLVVGILAICLYGRDLNILTFGDETAGQLGLPVEWTKGIILLLSTLITGVAVALAGTVGFVGLIIPHLVRLVLGPDHRVLVPVSAMTGGIFLIWADTLARTVVAPVELPVGVVTAFLGAPFFVYLMRTRKKNGY